MAAPSAELPPGAVARQPWLRTDALGSKPLPQAEVGEKRPREEVEEEEVQEDEATRAKREQARVPGRHHARATGVS